MRRRGLGWILGILAAAAAVAVPAAIAGSDVEAAEGLTVTNFTPLSLSDRSVGVIVELAGDPWTVVQDKAGRKLTKAEREQVKSELKARQDALRPQIEQLGGKVEQGWQSAYNGLKVEIARKSVASLAQLPGVVGVHTIARIEFDHQNSMPLIGVPETWQSLPDGLLGEGVRIAVLDTGIDYTHANFGGPGTEAAYDNADASDTLPEQIGHYDPAKYDAEASFDLVGDNYDAGDPANDTPVPDPNPLDCNGHGSHVAGTATGFGVNTDGSTYTGPYDASTFERDLLVYPGVAPKAVLIGLRVFGCGGSSSEEVIVDAINMAVDADADVINMSLGSPFGSTEEPSAAASTNAVRAGTVVVASAGNSGPNQYIVGAPGIASGAISVAANDPVPDFPGITVQLSTGETIVALNANDEEDLPSGAIPVKVLKDDPATPDNEALGCNVSDFGDATGTLAVTLRGVCARVAKAINGQKAGAAAVAMINTDAGYPPFEGKITSNPDTGEPFEVTIPFLGVRGVLGPAPTDDPDKLVAADGGTATLSHTTISNPNYRGFASFSSGGPRRDDSFLKPDITAPGVSIHSTLVASGTEGSRLSGTSMAAPHVAGVAALTREAHPRWDARHIKAAIVNTGDPAGVTGSTGYRTSRGGTGEVTPLNSTGTEVVALGDRLNAAANFGFRELTADFTGTRTINLFNHGSDPATFNISQALPQGSPHTIGTAAAVTVPAGGQATVDVTLNVPAATAGNSQGAGLSFREVAGLIEFSPTGESQNNGIALRVPYYLVPRALSDVRADLQGQPRQSNGYTTTVEVTNPDGVIAGDADFYALGLQDGRDPLAGSNDLRAVGLQAFPSPIPGGPADEQLLVWGVNVYEDWSNASISDYELPVDVDNDGTDDYVVVVADQGLLTAGAFNGRMLVAVFSTRSPGASIFFLATARTDSSTILAPVLTRQLCRAGEPCLSSGSNPRLDYGIAAFDLGFGQGDDFIEDRAKFNPWTPAITNGQFVNDLAPGASASVPVTVNPAEAALTPFKGLMVVTLDDENGGPEATLVEVRLP